MLKEPIEIRPYIRTMSDIIYRQFQDLLQNGYYGLKKLEYRTGTKPQGKQLEIVQQTAQRLEEACDAYLYDHLKAVRVLQQSDNVTRDCLHYLQVYRKKGMVTLLQSIYPDLGQGSSLLYFDPISNRVKRRTPKGAPAIPTDPDMPERYPNGQGTKDIDWKWIVYKGMIMKVPMSEKRGTPVPLSILRDRTNADIQRMAEQHWENYEQRMRKQQEHIEKIEEVKFRLAKRPDGSRKGTVLNTVAGQATIAPVYFDVNGDPIPPIDRNVGAAGPQGPVGFEGFFDARKADNPVPKAMSYEDFIKYTTKKPEVKIEPNPAFDEPQQNIDFDDEEELDEDDKAEW